MRGSTSASANSCSRRAAKRGSIGRSFRGLGSPKELCTKPLAATQVRASVELQVPGKAVGVLYLDRSSSQPTFTADDLHLSEALGSNIAAGMERFALAS